MPNYNVFINAYVRDRAVVVDKLTKNGMHMLLGRTRGYTEGERRKGIGLGDDDEHMKTMLEQSDFPLLNGPFADESIGTVTYYISSSSSLRLPLSLNASTGRKNIILT